jgi:hypothetical protein
LNLWSAGQRFGAVFASAQSTLRAANSPARFDAR